MSEHKRLKLTLDDIARMAAKGHSVFSPSGSKMWLTCLGSLIPNVLADDESSEEAAEGTVAHGLAEEWLRTGKRPRGVVGMVEVVDDHEIEITEEMLAYVGDYVSYVQELEEDAVEFLIETRVDFSDLTPIPDQGGTADNIAIVADIGDNGGYEIIVTDLKYGKGVRVVAEGNTQGKLYAYGAWKMFRDKYDLTSVTIRICHPRLEGGITETSVTIPELLEFAEHVRERAFAAWQFDAPRTPSEEGCQWCRVKGTCPALYAHLAEVTSEVFEGEDDHYTYTADEQREARENLEDDLGGPAFKPFDPQQLSTAALAKVLRYRKLMENFFNAVEAELLERALSREERIPGWKIVEGRTRRKWPDDLEAAVELRKAGLKDSAIFVTEVISPAEAERKLHAKAGLATDEAAKVVNSIAVKPQGNRSLVRVTDARGEALNSGDVFADDDD